MSFATGVEGDVLLPGLYPSSHEQTDDEVKLGRATEWLGAAGEVTRGAGGKLFLSGERTIRFVEMARITTTVPAGN